MDEPTVCFFIGKMWNILTSYIALVKFDGSGHWSDSRAQTPHGHRLDQEMQVILLYSCCMRR